MDSKQLEKIEYLFYRYTDGSITREEMDALNSYMLGSKYVQDKYLDYLKTTIALRCCLEKRVLDVRSPQSLFEDMQEMAEHENTAPVFEIPQQQPQKELIQKVVYPTRKKQKMSKFSVCSLILSGAAILLMVLFVQIVPPLAPPVATLTDSIDAKWVDMKDIPVHGDILRQGELILAKGLAEITFDNGAVVVVEAPAVFELESPKSMFVTSGKVSAVVSEYAAGFTINTSNASIVDLGTEFGVSVEGDGSCSLHMFKGKANLITGKAGQRKMGQIINENEANSVDSMTGKVERIKLGEKSFVRRINSENSFVWHGESLDIADVVGGGDGFGTGRRGVSINPDTGKIQNGFIWRNGIPVKGEGGYALMKTSQGIDGVFVPNGEKRKVVVSSLGHVFEECPATLGLYCWDIYNGNSLLDGQLKDGSRHQLDGVECGTAANPALTFHSNAGITFDLDTIRSKLIGCEVVAFESSCGMADFFKGTPDPSNSIRFWVLVDGQVKYQSELAHSQDPADEIYVKLTDQDRFLTLIVEDASQGEWSIQVDWAIFAKPRLILK